MFKFLQMQTEISSRLMKPSQNLQLQRDDVLIQDYCKTKYNNNIAIVDS